MKEVAQGSGGRIQTEEAYDLSARSLRGFSINSRTIQRNEVFVALQGPHFDGHAFVSDALERGGAGAIVSLSAFRQRAVEWHSRLKKHLFVVVEDPLQALQATARWHRRRFSLPLVGVAGSNGKTCTKEMIADILCRRGPVLKNEGNLNNHIGLPLSLLRLKKGDRAAVLEMGISRKGEMEGLCAIAAPTVGLITNIGPAHLAGLGNLEGVAREKGHLFQAIDRSGGTAVINQDDPWLRPWESKVSSCWTFGFEPSADVRATDLEEGVGGMTFNLHLNREGQSQQRVCLSAVGRHQVVNALAAAAVSAVLGVALDDIRKGLETFRPPANRGEVIIRQGIHILFDAYNANPASMKAGLEMISSYHPSTRMGEKQGRKMVILGDMFELGDLTESAHFDVGQWVAETGLDSLIAVGEWAEKMGEGARQGGLPAECISIHQDLESVRMVMRKEFHAGDCILIKGSRRMKMERLLDVLDSEGSH
ncbi:MAG: UDP-N-acetylmuramoyl-tripeptide--D-alanyl-D-alanine ligase [Nitrospira sp.]